MSVEIAVRIEKIRKGAAANGFAKNPVQKPP